MRDRVSAEWKLVALFILATAAFIGYLTGHGRSTAPAAESVAEASNAVTTVSYPSSAGWRQVASAPSIPDLPLSEPIVLAPDGDSARAGLIVGGLIGGESSPLPAQLLARLPSVPSAEIVDLPNTQAYRYSQMTIAGPGTQLRLYTIPISVSSAAAIACYASAGSSIYMRACERLLGTLTIATGRPPTEARNYASLTPSVGYERQVRVAIARADALLRALRRQIRGGRSAGRASRAARRLANGLASAAEILTAPPPPAAVGRVGVALSQSLKQMGADYSALAASVSAGNATGYEVARTAIYADEADLNSSLKDFALLGYG